MSKIVFYEIVVKEITILQGGTRLQLNVVLVVLKAMVPSIYCLFFTVCVRVPFMMNYKSFLVCVSFELLSIF